jgi:beta-N-acetylhexosaminidase
MVFKSKAFLVFLLVSTLYLVFYFVSIREGEVKKELGVSMEEREELIGQLSIEEKVGQLFIIGFEGKNMNSEIEELIRVVRPGGIFLSSRNIENENQLKKLINDLQKISLEETGIPLFISVDQEGEPVRRIKWIKDNISQSDIKDKEEAYHLGIDRGEGLKSLGINLNLAPVADFVSQGDYLYSRSFQRTPQKNGTLAEGLILGQKEAGILSTLKHFPGYGGISFNPETEIIPVLDKVPATYQFKKSFCL